MTKDLKSSHYAVLLIIMALNEMGMEATANAISAIPLLHADSVTRVVNDLVELGLVRRDQTVASHGKGHQSRFFTLIGLRDLLPFLRGRKSWRQEAE